MKKVFISVPMKGRTKENIEKSIEKMKTIASTLLDEEVEFINTIVEEKPPYNTSKEAIWYLGKSIEILSQCDVLVCLNDIYDFSGCIIEEKVALEYNMQVIELQLEYICPDILEIRRKRYEGDKAMSL